VTLEWQVAQGSRTLHVIDTDAPAWRNPDGTRRRSGPRSLCGRYPQRNAEYPWWSWPVADWSAIRGRPYELRRCQDCADALSV
jgi:hypothetical protein